MPPTLISGEAGFWPFDPVKLKSTAFAAVASRAAADCVLNPLPMPEVDGTLGVDVEHAASEAATVAVAMAAINLRTNTPFAEDGVENEHKAIVTYRQGSSIRNSASTVAALIHRSAQEANSG